MWAVQSRVVKKWKSVFPLCSKSINSDATAENTYSKSTNSYAKSANTYSKSMKTYSKSANASSELSDVKRKF